MTKSALLLTMSVMSVASLADSSVVADLKELYKVEREWQATLMSPDEHRAYLEKIRDRVRPIVSKEFAKLADGEVTPLVRDLLEDPEAMDFCWTVLFTQFPTYSADSQARGLDAIFNATPDPQRGRVIWSFLILRNFQTAAFSGKEVQKWLVDTINGGMPAGAFYFILTDESADAVSKMARASMRRFTKRRDDNDGNLFSLLSAAFLASRGEDAAVKHLDSLLDKRNIDSLLDTAFVIQAAAMSGNEKLVKKICDIITTDKRSRWNGEDCMPRETSFAHIAASACSLTVEGFPSIGYWEDYDEDMKKKVHDWLKDNPTYKVKPDPRVFFKETPFSRVITAMSRQFKERQGSEKP